MPIPLQSYQAARGKMDTGDLILFDGKGQVSSVIKHLTRSRWSHVGMVYRIPSHDLVLLWESTSLSNLKDITTGVARRGVQLVPLRERVRTYPGKVGWRKLNVPRTGPAMTALNSLRLEVSGRNYEESMIELIKAAYDGSFGRNVEDLSSLFCSELVAEAYQRMRLLDGTLPSNEYTPKDFSTETAMVDGALLQGTLDDEVLIAVH